MIKTTLVKWLEEKSKKALFATEEKYQKERARLLYAACSDLGLTAAAGEIESLFNEACMVWNKWKSKHENTFCEFTDTYWFSFTRLINDYISEEGAALKAILTHMVKLETKEMEILRTEYIEMCTNINQSYTTVIEAVRASKNAKEASSYLLELGFDLSEVESVKAPVTALTVPINTAYLFIGQEAA